MRIRVLYVPLVLVAVACSDVPAPTEPASLRLVTQVVNDNGRTAVPGDFTLTAAGPTPIWGAGQVSSGPAFLPGTYTLSETGPVGYTPGAWTCTGGTQTGSRVTLAATESAVCEITNDDVVPNFVRLQSDSGDYIGQGASYEYTQANAVVSMTASGVHLAISISGDQGSKGDFQEPNSVSLLEPGTYTGVTRWPFNSAAVGGLSWTSGSRGCNTLTGSFTVERVAYVSDTLGGIDLSFEQHCESATAALHGQIHWFAGDPTLPPDPVYPVPDTLWRPAPGATPNSGNYLYLNSDAGDYIGQGQTYTYTLPNDSTALWVKQGHLYVSASAWHGDFQTMYTLSQLELGYYPGVTRYPFHNPTKGGLDWSGEGRGCNSLVGWFAVDRVVYGSGVLTGLDVRFEQHCEGGAAALHGAVHWDR